MMRPARHGGSGSSSSNILLCLDLDLFAIEREWGGVGRGEDRMESTSTINIY